MVVCTGEQRLQMVCPAEDHGDMRFIINLTEYINETIPRIV